MPGRSLDIPFAVIRLQQFSAVTEIFPSRVQLCQFQIHGAPLLLCHIQSILCCCFTGAGTFKMCCLKMQQGNNHFLSRFEDLWCTKMHNLTCCVHRPSEAHTHHRADYIKPQCQEIASKSLKRRRILVSTMLLKHYVKQIQASVSY